MTDTEILDFLEENLNSMSHARATSSALMGGETIFGQCRLGGRLTGPIAAHGVRDFVARAADLRDTWRANRTPDGSGDGGDRKNTGMPETQTEGSKRPSDELGEPGASAPEGEKPSPSDPHPLEGVADILETICHKDYPLFYPELPPDKAGELAAIIRAEIGRSLEGALLMARSYRSLIDCDSHHGALRRQLRHHVSPGLTKRQFMDMGKGGSG